MRYAVSDLHGCFLTFRKGLEEIDFSTEDTLYILGDIVDKHPRVKELIDYILYLKRGFDIQCIKGNHDDLLLGCIRKEYGYDYRRYLIDGGYKTMESYNCDILKPQITEEHFNFLYNLPYHIELDDAVLVHGGLKFKGDKLLELMYPSLVNYPITDPINQTSEHDKMWCRSFAYDKEMMNGKRLIVGHTALEIDVIQDLIEKNEIIGIDGGCVYKQYENYGNMVFFNLDTNEIKVVKNCEV